MTTIKLVGISGSGKTTITKFLSKKLDFFRMSYGDYIKSHQANAEEEWNKDLRKTEGLVLIEEHLEFGENNLYEIYKKEKTKIIFFMDVDPYEILKRRRSDAIKNRELDIDGIKEDQEKAKKRAFLLAKKLKIPFILLRGLSVDENLAVLIEKISRIAERESLIKKQQKLSDKLKFVDFDLESCWNSHWLIEKLRKAVYILVHEKLRNSDIPFDPQDLEHQSLFYLTTFSPGKITEKNITEAVNQQYLLIRNRIKNNLSQDEFQYLFRGLKKFYPDLNSEYRLYLKWDNGKLFAVGDGRKFEVEFRKVDPEDEVVTLFTDVLHYIHSSRKDGDVFAFYFKGDHYPWAIETAELSIISREYKKDALLAHGIDPSKAVELTRMYTLPGSPLSSISVMDGLIRKYYKKKGLEAIFTCTMPAYSKTKSTTVSGGLNNVLCIKKLQHFYKEVYIDGEICWEHVTKREIEEKGYKNLKITNSDFYLSPVIDVFDTIIRRRQLAPLKELEDKVISYI